MYDVYVLGICYTSPSLYTAKYANVVNKLLSTYVHYNCTVDGIIPGEKVVSNGVTTPLFNKLLYIVMLTLLSVLHVAVTNTFLNLCVVSN